MNQPTTLAHRLARWATEVVPEDADGRLALTALHDTLAVSVAAIDETSAPVAAQLSEPALFGSLSHLLDYDDLHLPSTTHISAVCVPATLAAGGAASAYLAGAGVMARLGAAMGWEHYASGWHASCTVGAVGAAVAASRAFGLDAETTAHAVVLAIPASGGVQRAFGTMGKPLQVGFAVEAGLRAARLARAGARSDLASLEQWMPLVSGDPDTVILDGPCVPGGLAVKLSACCYALQRPIDVTRQLREVSGAGRDVTSVVVRAPAAAVAPLHHHRPRTAMEGKFSLEYATAAALIGPPEGPLPFTEEWVRRNDIQQLISLVEFHVNGEGRGLLDGEHEVTVSLRDGATFTARGTTPPGAPESPAGPAELALKLQQCCGDLAPTVAACGWQEAPTLLREAVAQRGLHAVVTA